MATITWPSHRVAETIKKIRDVIGRTVELRVKVEGVPCPAPDCFYDPSTGLSTNPFCPICGGDHFINTISGVMISGHVRWRGMESPVLRAGGVVPEGDCTVTIEYTQQNQTFVEKSKNVIIDNKLLTLKNYRLKGQPQPNRIAITLIQETDE